eukprot:Nk52_evm34s212 gene=Nk52_evmTU34s212
MKSKIASRGGVISLLVLLLFISISCLQLSTALPTTPDPSSPSSSSSNSKENSSNINNNNNNDQELLDNLVADPDVYPSPFVPGSPPIDPVLLAPPVPSAAGLELGPLGGGVGVGFRSEQSTQVIQQQAVVPVHYPVWMDPASAASFIASTMPQPLLAGYLGSFPNMVLPGQFDLFHSGCDLICFYILRFLDAQKNEKKVVYPDALKFRASVEMVEQKLIQSDDDDRIEGEMPDGEKKIHVKVEDVIFQTKFKIQQDNQLAKIITYNMVDKEGELKKDGTSMNVTVKIPMGADDKNKGEGMNYEEVSVNYQLKVQPTLIDFTQPKSDNFRLALASLTCMDEKCVAGKSGDKKIKTDFPKSIEFKRSNDVTYNSPMYLWTLAFIKIGGNNHAFKVHLRVNKIAE